MKAKLVHARKITVDLPSGKHLSTKARLGATKLDDIPPNAEKGEEECSNKPHASEGLKLTEALESYVGDTGVTVKPNSA